MEPLALIAAPIVAPIAINICYTAGWLLDAPLRLIFPTLNSRFTSWLFTLGFVFSVLLVSFPALYWGAVSFSYFMYSTDTMKNILCIFLVLAAPLTTHLPLT